MTDTDPLDKICNLNEESKNDIPAELPLPKPETTDLSAVSNVDDSFSLEKLLEEFEVDNDAQSKNQLTDLPSQTGRQQSSANRLHGDNFILRCAKVQGISKHISNAVDRTNAGLATACAVSLQIAVGTSHGHILNFNFTQNLTWVYQDNKDQGSVAALAFNKDCTHLLAGFAGGLLLVMDAVSGDVLKLFTDVLTPGAGVMHVKWTSYVELILCVDTSGSLWSLNLMRKLNKRSCTPKCLMNGAQGEVCVVEPLNVNLMGSHHFDQHCIIALATLNKYYVAMLRPHFKIIKHIRLQDGTAFLPVLCWQMVLMQASDSTRSVDPVLVVGKGNQIFFHQLFLTCGKISLVSLRSISLHNNLISLHWMGPKCIACVDCLEILHLIDIRTEKRLECIELSEVGLIYGSPIFKGLATGCNVSANMALAGANACYNSIVSHDTNIFLLGSRSLYLIAVRTWMERINYLVKNQRMREAFVLALNGYKIAGERHKQKTQAKERILLLFKEYMKTPVLAANSQSEVIKCLMHIGETDLLYTQLWDRLEDKDQFLNLLTTYIENEMLQTVPTYIAQELVNYWLKISAKKLDEILIKLNWTCLDLHQVLNSTKQHHLYRAHIYLHTHALNDYTTFLIDLIPIVNTTVTATTDLGNCLLVYLSSALTGRAYPFGDIAAEKKNAVRNKVLQTLLAPNYFGQTITDLPYPYLRKMLEFNTRATLNVLTLAFQEQDIAENIVCRKNVINILLEILTNDQAMWTEFGCILNHITQQLLQQKLLCDDHILTTLLSLLSIENIPNETLQQRFERERIWLELLANNSFVTVSTIPEQLALAKQAHCYFVQEQLLEQLETYDSILDCYLNNPLRHKSIFEYIEKHIAQTEREICKQVKVNLKHLLQIDAKETMRIIQNYMKNAIDELLDTLSCDENSLKMFLQQLHEQQMRLSKQQCELYIELLCKHKDKELLMNALQTIDDYDVERIVHLVLPYKMSEALIFLYEKQDKYFQVLDLYMAIMKDEDAYADNEALLQGIGTFCARATKQLSNSVEREQFWLKVIQLISQNNCLQSITKEMLHEACQIIDARKITEMIICNQSAFSDFHNKRELLAIIISTLRQKMDAKKSESKSDYHENHKLLHAKHKQTQRGLWVNLASCLICCNHLYDEEQILVIGKCHHAVHRKCFEQYFADDGNDKTKSQLDCNQNDFNSQQIQKRSYKCLKCETNNANVHLLMLVTTDSTNFKTINACDKLKDPCLLQLKISPKSYVTS